MHHRDHAAHISGFTCATARRTAPVRTFDALRIILRGAAVLGAMIVIHGVI